MNPIQATIGAVHAFKPKSAEDMQDAYYGKNVQRFFFARNPYDRLVSAYVQKFELEYKNDFIFGSEFDKPAA